MTARNRKRALCCTENMGLNRSQMEADNKISFLEKIEYIYMINLMSIGYAK